MIKLKLTAEQLEVIDGALEMYCMGLAEQNDPHLKYAVDAQKAVINIIAERSGHTVSVLPEMNIKTTSFMPEHIELEYITNGFQGGDAGHGGFTTLKIKPPSTCAVVKIGNREIEIEESEPISITVRGDWESGGFARAFIKLGKKLIKKTRA